MHAESTATSNPLIATAPAPATSLPALIAREARRSRNRRLLWTAAGVFLVSAAFTAWWIWRPRPAPMAARFRTEALTHGDLVREVRATGRLAAMSTVSVGAEISGKMASVEVDFNDHVKAGQVLARFDRVSLEAQRAQSAAMAIAAKAQLAQARSDLEQARRTDQRADDLYAKGAQSEAEHEAAVTALALATGRVAAAEANLAAQVALSAVSHTNLEHTVIRSPIDGVIITRNVDPGQTVASMLQTPVLFTVAADLRKMEVLAAVDEADVAEVAVGQPVLFTVNAFQTRVFEGTVTEVRNAANLVQDVVTYGVVIAVDNLDLALKPSMTASVRIRTGQAKNVDLVPNAALRFVPPDQSAPKKAAQRTEASGVAREASTPVVWTLQGQTLVSHQVSVGLTDGELTSVRAPDLPAGATVIVDLTTEGKKAYDLIQPK